MPGPSARPGRLSPGTDKDCRAFRKRPYYVICFDRLTVSAPCAIERSGDCRPDCDARVSPNQNGLADTATAIQHVARCMRTSLLRVPDSSYSMCGSLMIFMFLLEACAITMRPSASGLVATQTRVQLRFYINLPSDECIRAVAPPDTDTDIVLSKPPSRCWSVIT